MPRRPRRASGRKRARSQRRPTATQAPPVNRPRPATTPGESQPGRGATVRVERVRPRGDGTRGDRSRMPRAVRRMAWQVHGTAALCAAGGVLGLVRFIGELEYHAGSGVSAISVAGAALSVGVLLGLWLPRRLIRRRLESDDERGALGRKRGDGAEGATEAGPLHVAYEFAASLSGALLLALGVLWAGLIGLMAGLETYRGWLVEHFVHPPGTTRVLLAGPSALGLVLVGAVGATALIALQGWHRLLTQPRTRALFLWVTLLAGGAAGACVAALVGRPAWLDVGTLLALFGASVLAVCYRAAGCAPTRLPAGAAGRTADWLQSLLVIGMLFALVAVSAVAAAGDGIVWRGTARGVVVAGVAALGGALVAGVVLPRIWATFDPLLPSMVLAAVVWGSARFDVPLTMSLADPARLAILAGLAGLCTVRVGQRITRALGRPQRALAWVGGAAAGGATLGFGLAPLLMPAAGRALTPVSAAAGPLGALLTRDQTLRTEAFVVGDIDRTGANARAWDVDLAGPRWDVIVLTHELNDATEDVRDGRAARRLLNRCTRGLLAGGRLVIEPASGPLAAAARAAPPGPIFLARSTDSAQACEAMLIGVDVPAWVEHQLVGSTQTIELYPIEYPTSPPADVTARTSDSD